MTLSTTPIITKTDSLKTQATHNLLQNYIPCTPEEQVYKDHMIQLITTCDKAFHRRCRVGHFTASALLLNPNKTHVLLMHHTKLDKWMQLGGHCDGDSDVLNVAIKEACEESGIKAIKPLMPKIFDLDIHLIPTNTKDDAHYHFDIRFLLHAYEHDRFIQNHESKALRWVAKNGHDSPATDQSVGRLFNKLKSIKL
jgi:8-oxo-dGTP pyrophosphatase MutT (NUDIX family)